MHRRYENSNIPSEIVRSFLCVAELGSLTEAAKKLGLSQPAVSMQIRRFEALTGGEVFERGPGYTRLSSRGSLMLNHAKRMMEANDQLLSLAGGVQDPRNVRIGVTAMYVEKLTRVWAESGLSAQHLYFHCDQSPELERLLVDGHLDVACMVDANHDTGTTLASWFEDYSWVRAPGFTLPPGMPLPLVCWPGALYDQPAIKACETAGIRYRVAFASHDASARISAATAGLGVLATLPHFAGDGLHVADDAYLPPLGARRISIQARPDFDVTAASELVEVLRRIAPAG